MTSKSLDDIYLCPLHTECSADSLVLNTLGFFFFPPLTLLNVFKLLLNFNHSSQTKVPLLTYLFLCSQYGSPRSYVKKGK